MAMLVSTDYSLIFTMLLVAIWSDISGIFLGTCHCIK